MRRAAGPWIPRIATSPPPRPVTGAASALRSGSRSPSASAQPCSRTAASSAASRTGSVIVRSVHADQDGRLAAAEGEQHLAHRRRVADARAADAGHADDAGLAGDEVHGHRLAVARHRQRRRLPGPLDERAQLRPCQIAHVEAGEHAVGQRDEVQPEPVRAARLALDEAAALERREQPRGAARVHPDPARERVDARGPLGQGVEQRDRAGHGPDRPAGRVPEGV